MRGPVAGNLAIPRRWPNPIRLDNTVLEVTFDGHQRPYRHVISRTRLLVEGTRAEGTPYVATRVGHEGAFVAHFTKNGEQIPTVVDLLVDHHHNAALGVERCYSGLATRPFSVHTLRGSLGPFTVNNLLGGAGSQQYPRHLTITLDGDTRTWTLELSPLGRIKSWRRDTNAPARFGQGRIMHAAHNVDLLIWEHPTGTGAFFLDSKSSTFFGTVFFTHEHGDPTDTPVTGNFLFSTETHHA